MKIIEDPTSDNPPHTLCKVDIHVILAELPSDSVSSIRTVRLSADIKESPMDIARFHPPDGALMINSRGFTTEEVVYAVVVELLCHACAVIFHENHQIHAVDQYRINQIAVPYLETILPQLSQKMVRLDKLPTDL